MIVKGSSHWSTYAAAGLVGFLAPPQNLSCQASVSLNSLPSHRSQMNSWGDVGMTCLTWCAFESWTAVRMSSSGYSNFISGFWISTKTWVSHSVTPSVWYVARIAGPFPVGGAHFQLPSILELGARLHLDPTQGQKATGREASQVTASIICIHQPRCNVPVLFKGLSSAPKECVFWPKCLVQW